jgi:hypothetical protein
MSVLFLELRYMFKTAILVPSVRALSLGLIRIIMFVLAAASLAASPFQTAIPQLKDRVILPGVGMGPLRIGDSQETALKLFPRKPNIDEDVDKVKCGVIYLWVDSESPSGGNVYIWFKDGAVSQIESATKTFMTREGLTTRDSPEMVRRYYKHLRAYELLGNTSEAMGRKPLIFWVDAEQGIAFEFAFGQVSRTRYLFGIIVFQPGTQFCPNERETTPSEWRELSPYSLEPPNRKA